MGVCVSFSPCQTSATCSTQSFLRPPRNQQEIQTRLEQQQGTMHPRIEALYNSALPAPDTVATVNLNLCHLGASGALHVSGLLHFCPNITVLKLWKCRIGVKGAEFLAKHLREASKLQVLSLDDNGLGPQGSTHIATALPYLTSLREFYYRSNELQCQGVKTLAEALSYLVNLTALTLDENDITSFGLESLLDNVSFQKLERLGLSANRITDYGAYLLIQSAKDMGNLKALQFQGNLVSSKAIDMLQKTFAMVEILL